MPSKIEIKKFNYNTVSLQPLIIPSGWKIKYNSLFEIEPSKNFVLENGPEGFTIWDIYFKQDLYQAENERRGILIDVGWYPENDPEGYYNISVVKSHYENKRIKYDWEHPLEEIQVKELKKLTNTLNVLFLKISNNEYERAKPSKKG